MIKKNKNRAALGMKLALSKRQQEGRPAHHVIARVAYATRGKPNFLIFVALCFFFLYNQIGCMKRENLLSEIEINQKIKELEMKNIPQLLGSSVRPGDEPVTSSGESVIPSLPTDRYFSWEKKLDELKHQTIISTSRAAQEKHLEQIELHIRENPSWKSQMEDMAQTFSVMAQDRMKQCDQEIQKAKSRILAGEDKNKVLEETSSKIDELDRGPMGMSLGIRSDCREKLRKI